MPDGDDDGAGVGLSVGETIFTRVVTSSGAPI